VADAPELVRAVAAATAAELQRANALESATGQAALVLAKQIDARRASGAGLAALLETYRGTLAEAVRDAERADDPLEKIRISAALKLIRGLS
jgi:hypothetical protein